jgi:DNA-directed RNA polymerase subunit RPC12/RpoP
MGERKVLNKYYPPDFDPTKLPRGKASKNNQWVVRTMAPFSMRCLGCGNYIYHGTKFNARMESAMGEDYLGIRIKRFYVKCPRCSSEIVFKTDPKNSDYVIEHGAQRNFDGKKIGQKMMEEFKQKRELEEQGNAMKVLENRTLDTRWNLTFSTLSTRFDR